MGSSHEHQYGHWYGGLGAEPAGSTCEGLWSIFATDVGSFVRKPPDGCPARAVSF
jgi:hypothetical protein